MHTHTGVDTNGVATDGQLPDDGVDKVKAADINPLLAAILDSFKAILNGKTNLKLAVGYAFDILGGLILRASGSASAEDGFSLAGYWDFGGADVLGLAQRLVEVTPTTLADPPPAKIGISAAPGVTVGRRFLLTNAPGGVRTIAIAKTGAERTGDTIEVLVSKGLATGQQYILKRDGSGNNICQFYGDEPGATGVWARFQFRIDDEWHLDINSGGTIRDTTTNAAALAGGVIPGLDA